MIILINYVKNIFFVFFFRFVVYKKLCKIVFKLNEGDRRPVYASFGASGTETLPHIAINTFLNISYT